MTPFQAQKSAEHGVTSVKHSYSLDINRNYFSKKIIHQGYAGSKLHSSLAFTKDKTYMQKDKLIQVITIPPANPLFPFPALEVLNKGKITAII